MPKNLDMQKNSSRRNFIKKMGGAAAVLALKPDFATAEKRILRAETVVSANDKIRVGLIGAGIIGHYDIDTALKVPGVELAAVCDLYDGRLEYAREKFGATMPTTRDYREILARKDVDAVLICVPDHWHARITRDAFAAGKHVYCEKPMVQRLEDGLSVVEAERKSGKKMQVGSQRASSIAIHEARKQYLSGIIGELNFVEGFYDRWTSNGAWNYSIPTDASPETCDWDRFIEGTPKLPFDAKRFFRWRNYRNYGTGVAGDLFVHLLTGLHTVTDSIGPKRVFAIGDLNYWKDGRDANDLVVGMMDYPQTAQHPSFPLVLRSNLADGGAGRSAFRVVGSDGVIEIGWNDFKVKHFKRPKADGFGGYDSYTSFSAKQKVDFEKWYNANYGGVSTDWVVGKDIEYATEEGYDDRYDHLANFFEAVRTGKPCVEDSAFGFRAAAPCLLANMSADKKKELRWDPSKMKMVK